MEKVFWTPKEGKVINVDDMSEQHLRNTLKMLIRNDWIHIRDEMDYYDDYMGSVDDIY